MIETFLANRDLIREFPRRLFDDREESAGTYCCTVPGSAGRTFGNKTGELLIFVITGMELFALRVYQKRVSLVEYRVLRILLAAKTKQYCRHYSNVG